MILDKLQALEKDVSSYLRMFIDEREKHDRKSEKAILAKKLMKFKRRLDRAIKKLEKEAPAIAVNANKDVVISKEEVVVQTVAAPVLKEETPIVVEKAVVTEVVEAKVEETSSGMGGNIKKTIPKLNEEAPNNLSEQAVVVHENQINIEQEQKQEQRPVENTIEQSVGNKGRNQEVDTITIQLLLNESGAKLKVDGICGNATIQAIARFQKNRLGYKKQDGRVDPGGKTLAGLNKRAIAAAIPKSIAASVGDGGKNDIVDAKIIQRLLRKNSMRITIDGICGKGTIAAIKTFQREVLGMEGPSGLIEPNDQTLDALNGKVVKVERPAEIVNTVNTVNTETSIDEVTSSRPEKKGNINRTLRNRRKENLEEHEQDKRDNEQQDKTENEREEAEGIATNVGESIKGGGFEQHNEYNHYVHENWEESTFYMGSGRTAKPLNNKAARLLRSVLAGAGIPEAKVTSTLRNYADQAYIVLTQVTREEAYGWYSWIRDYSSVFENYYEQHENGGDKEQIYEEYGAWIETTIGLRASNHLTGIAIDIARCDLEKFNAFAQTLVDITGSGVRKVFQETGRTHIEFMFEVC